MLKLIIRNMCFISEEFLILIRLIALVFVDDLASTEAEEVEIAFTKADLVNKNDLNELFSKRLDNVFTAQDIILSSIDRKNKKILTCNATACEIGLHDPSKLSFFLKKEYLYGTSVFDAWRHSNKDWLKSTRYFREKLFRVLFIGSETLAVLGFFLDLLLWGGGLQVPLLAVIFGIGIFYTQAVLVRIDFWGFWRRGSRRFGALLASGIYVVLLDFAYALGILRRLL